jgi:protein SCO1/2
MGHEVTPVFISVDPSRDTPEVLKEWTDYIHPRMIGLTGTPEEIATVASEYRTYYKVPENPTDDLYTVDHMTQTYLMLPQYGFVDFFTREATPEEIAERTACFIDAARK